MTHGSSSSAVSLSVSDSLLSETLSLSWRSGLISGSTGVWGRFELTLRDEPVDCEDDDSAGCDGEIGRTGEGCRDPCGGHGSGDSMRADTD